MYVLVNKKPSKAKDVEAWGEWMSNAARTNEIVVGRDLVSTDKGENLLVSTVFLGSSTSDDNLFETMVLSGIEPRLNKRYSSWLKAENGHKKTIDALKGNKNV